MAKAIKALNLEMYSAFGKEESMAQLGKSNGNITTNNELEMGDV